MGLRKSAGDALTLRNINRGYQLSEENRKWELESDNLDKSLGMLLLVLYFEFVGGFYIGKIIFEVFK